MLVRSWRMRASSAAWLPPARPPPARPPPNQDRRAGGGERIIGDIGDRPIIGDIGDRPIIGDIGGRPIIGDIGDRPIIGDIGGRPIIGERPMGDIDAGGDERRERRERPKSIMVVVGGRWYRTHTN